VRLRRRARQRQVQLWSAANASVSRGSFDVLRSSLDVSSALSRLLSSRSFGLIQVYETSGCTRVATRVGCKNSVVTLLRRSRIRG
jgi:hypothetical protein